MKIQLRLFFYHTDQATKEEIEDFSDANTEIIAHCSNVELDEKFICWDYPKPLPESSFWTYKKDE